MNHYSDDSIFISRSLSPSPPKKGPLPRHEGILYGKTGICFSWKQLYVKAVRTTLHINEGVPNGDLFTVNINDYDITWQGKLQEKFTVVLKNRSENLEDIRWLYLGADNKDTAWGWYQYFASVAERPPLRKDQDMGQQDEQVYIKSKPRGSVVQSDTKSKGGSPPNMGHIRGNEVKNGNKSPYRESYGTQEYNEQDMVDTGVEDDYSIEGGDFMLPEEAPEWVQNLFMEHIANKSMWKETGEGIQKGAQWEVMASETGKMSVVVANSKIDRQVFRCECGFRRSSPQMIVKALLDVEKKTDWDPNVESVKMLFYTPSTKQSILKQVNRSQGAFHLKREFVYMRYVFSTQNAYFIVDKSHKDNGIADMIGISRDIAYRGQIDYSIIRVMEKDDKTYFTQLIKMTNGGFLTTAQDSKMTLSSLVNNKNIEKIMALYIDEDDSDLVLIPCPKREERSRWKQMMTNKSNKKKASPSPNKRLGDSRFHIHIAGINKEGYLLGTTNRSRSEGRTYRTEEENLQEEDIDEKILVFSKKGKKQDMWEIELSTSSKQASPDYPGLNRNF